MLRAAGLIERMQSRQIVAIASVFSHDACTLKDVAGGYGTVFSVGPSVRAKFLEQAKSRVAKLPPVVYGYLASAIESLGYIARYDEVRTVTLMPTPKAAHAVLVHTTLADNLAERAWMNTLRARGMRVVAFGAACSTAPASFVEDADVVIVGEPEAMNPAQWQSVLNEAQGIVHAGDVHDLDALLLPSWRAFPVHEYRYAFLANGITLPMQSARGCPYSCGYCPWRVTASFRERSPEAVVAEARRNRDVYGAKAISFRDPLFNLSAERSARIAEGLAPLGLRWSAEMRADRLDYALLRTMHRGGLRSLELGVESVNRALLIQEKRKPPTEEQIERVVREAASLGIRVICNFVLGLPGDSLEGMKETIAWAKELNSFAVQFTVATPYPGTSLAQKRATSLPVVDANMTGFTATQLEGGVSPEALAALREWAYVSYHFRPRFIAGFVPQLVRALV